MKLVIDFTLPDLTEVFTLFFSCEHDFNTWQKHTKGAKVRAKSWQIVK